MERGERGELGILAGGRGAQGVLGSRHGAARVTWGAQVGRDVLHVEWKGEKKNLCKSGRHSSHSTSPVNCCIFYTLLHSLPPDL